MNKWKAALDHELVHIGTTVDSFKTPKEAIDALVNWNLAVAADPAVNGGFELVSSSDVQALREALEAMLDYAGQPISHPAAQLARAALASMEKQR